MELSVQRHPAIRSEHLSRKAIVYLRQSRPEQVEHNKGSTQFQRDQAQYPRSWGWPEDRIVVIDEDLGKSGSSAIHRSGYQQMEAMIVANEVGAVFVAYLDRIGRRFRDSVVLIDECANHDVLVVPNGRILSMRDSGDRLLATMQLNVAEYENDGRYRTLYNGRLTKAKKGIAVSPPPAGYVSQDGQWIKDPEESVRAAIESVFRAFAEERSIVRTVARMAKLKMRIPRRRRHLVYWVDPDLSSVSFILKSASYVGDYIFRKRRTDPALGRAKNGRRKDRNSREDEMVVIRDHHVPYIPRERFVENQAILALNAPSKERRSMGPGPALLQGLVRCDEHGRALRTRYKVRKDGSRGGHYYACEGALWKGGSRCRSLRGAGVEAVVTEAILARLSPPELNLIRKVWREVRASEQDEATGRRLEQDRLRRCVLDLERRYLSVDPENRRVAVDLERRLEEAKLMLEEAERCGAGKGKVDCEVLSEPDFQRLIEICGELDMLWHAPTTRPRDRKEIARTLIQSVVVDFRAGDEVRGRVAWADGVPDTLFRFNPGGDSLALLRRLLAEGRSPGEVAHELNARGLKRRQRWEWTPEAVAKWSRKAG